MILWLVFPADARLIKCVQAELSPGMLSCPRPSTSPSHSYCTSEGLELLMCQVVGVRLEEMYYLLESHSGTWIVESAFCTDI